MVVNSSIRKWFNMARIDIKNQGGGNDVKILVVDGGGYSLYQAGWFSKGGAGYVMEISDKHLILELECKGAGKLLIRLLGIDRRMPDGNRIPLWVDYTRMAVNDELVFWEIMSQWHDKSYTFYRDVLDGEKVKLEISWDLHGYKGEELVQLLSIMKDITRNNNE